MAAHALIPIGILGGVLLLATKTSKPKSRRVSNPFTDMGCMSLRSVEDAQRWVDTVGFRRYQEAYAADPVTRLEPHVEQHLKIAKYVAWALAQLPIQCTPYNVVPDRRQLYKLMWCAAVGDLAGRGRVDEELAQVLVACHSAHFNPVDLELVK